MPEAPRITVTRLKEQEKKNRAKEQELKAKRAKIKAFKGLPPVGFIISLLITAPD